MTDPTTTFLNRLKGITLSSNERLAMRERLAMYADIHPAIQPASVSTGFFAWMSSRYAPAFAGALTLLVMVSGGVTLAANSSVPGEALYSLKIRVNEPVMTALAPTATGQARVAAILATRRVNEAVTLASRGKLTPERQTYLKQEFSMGVERAAKKVAVLESTGNTERADTVRADLAAHLAGQAQALGAVSGKDTSVSAELLQTVMTTSESIADSVDPGADIAVAVTEEVTPEPTAIMATTMATDAPAEDMARTMMAAKSAATLAPAATSTPAPRPTVTGRFTKQLHVGTSTFLGRTASTTLTKPNVLIPKLDIAIPRISVPFFPSSVSETGGSDTSIEVGE